MCASLFSMCAISKNGFSCIDGDIGFLGVVVGVVLVSIIYEIVRVSQHVQNKRAGTTR